MFRALGVGGKTCGKPCVTTLIEASTGTRSFAVNAGVLATAPAEESTVLDMYVGRIRGQLPGHQNEPLHRVSTFDRVPLRRVFNRGKNSRQFSESPDTGDTQYMLAKTKHAGTVSANMSSMSAEGAS